MKNFVFYYTVFRDYDLAMSMLSHDSEATKAFIDTAYLLCELEAQTFQTEESKSLIKKYYTHLYDQTKKFSSLKLSEDEWRLYAGLMCTFDEWCADTNFFGIDSEQQKQIFSENPVDGYFNLMQVHNHGS